MWAAPNRRWCAASGRPPGHVLSERERGRYASLVFRISSLALLVVALGGCAPEAPPRWAQGGAPLLIFPARWDRPDRDSIEIQTNGNVLEGGHLRFVIDRVGRVADDEYEPFAVLLPDGRLVGTDNAALGNVGFNNASPPFAQQAWLSLAPDGRVVRFEANGDRVVDGAWHGCDGPARRTCTLVTQVFAMRHYRVAPPAGLSVGVGVGFGL